MYSTAVLSDPRVNRVWFLTDFKNARTSLDSVGPVTPEASFPSEPQGDILVRAIVIVVVIMPSQDPLHRRLFLDSPEQPSVN